MGAVDRLARERAHRITALACTDGQPIDIGCSSMGIGTEQLNPESPGRGVGCKSVVSVTKNSRQRSVNEDRPQSGTIDTGPFVRQATVSKIEMVGEGQALQSCWRNLQAFSHPQGDRIHG